MSTETTATAQSAAGSTGQPNTPKKKVPWWVWALIGFVALALVIGVIWFVSQDDDDADDAGDAGVGPAPAAVEEAPEEDAADSAVEREEFAGTGDMVIPVAVAGAAIVSFTCEDCTGNVLVTSDSEEGMLVNGIGAYSGSRLVNMTDGSAMTAIAVEADGTWELVVDDVENAPSFDGAVTGTGDQAFWMTGEFESVAFVNGEQRGNHAVWAYRNGMTNPLILNGTGPADETAEMTGPALVQVSSKAEWTLTPQ
ncbi:hypothetical protein [Microbacterium sp. zg.Y909]|uniref:hypothetical protein n=1 Tax=Microbacterium sp. zg.Y909 TaxID=2969413 RepID=UPI00214B9468|nr:hypothetical protein [Microbacterium sp. zg.Y909]MCR2826250.1 hypothetical protein [Microbacterium sp. zg.Y909]